MLDYQRVPIVAQADAGRGVEYLPIVEWREVRLPEWARAFDRFVVAPISGDCLNGDGIFDGDFALVHLTKEIQQGDLCAVLVNGAILIKHVTLLADGRIKLESANPDYPSRVYELTEITIQGRVVRIERDL